MAQSIIVTGNPVDGFEFYGPFKSITEAAEHANTDGLFDDHDWWVADLHAVKE